MSVKGFYTVDELRVGVENLPGLDYMTYYERWLLSVIKTLV